MLKKSPCRNRKRRGGVCVVVDDETRLTDGRRQTNELSVCGGGRDRRRAQGEAAKCGAVTVAIPRPGAKGGAAVAADPSLVGHAYLKVRHTPSSLHVVVVVVVRREPNQPTNPQETRVGAKAAEKAERGRAVGGRRRASR